ncbi:MAG: glycosyltransferase family 1 protein [Candidatus Gastranaerophilales bacterium]|nr:glycosyltransferase family 1 protein [Candidatus Gastranaerophilales bacterium]
MSRIALNAIGRYMGGLESYIYNIVKALLDKDTINSYYLFIVNNQELIYEDLLSYENLKIISYPVDCANPVIRVLCENTLLPFDIIKHKINMVHHLCSYIPVISPYKSVVTIHDLVSFYYHNKYPEYKETKRSYNYFKKVASFVTAKAERIITVSEFTKQQLMSNFRVNEDKITVIGQSYDTRKNITSINSNILEKFGILKPYILAVSVIRPHKNFDFLVRVFNILKSKYKLPHQLVVVGDVHFGAEKFFNEIKNSRFKDEIQYLGKINADELSSIYSFANIFIYPSLYEGFGIPLLEAMSFKLPVAASNAASLQEVGGDACLYFNPCDENDACDKILKILDDETLKNRLISNQKAKLDYYSWNNIAEKILSIYNGVLGNTND